MVISNSNYRYLGGVYSVVYLDHKMILLYLSTIEMLAFAADLRVASVASFQLGLTSRAMLSEFVSSVILTTVV